MAKIHPVTHPLPAFWSQDEDEFRNFRSTPELPPDIDIVIVGSGYAGAATAWHLVQDAEAASNPTPSILMLEARGVCDGATGRNGGHMRPDLYGHIPHYIKRDGLEHAVELAEFEIAHVQALKQFIAKEKIDCDFVLARSVDVWSDPDAAEAAKNTYKSMSGHHLEYMNDVFFHHGENAESISGVKGAKAVASYTAGMMWPSKFIKHLLKRLITDSKLNLQTHTPVHSVQAGRTPGWWDVQTEQGTVQTKTVIYANNAYVAGLLPEYRNAIVPCKGICCHISVPEGKTPPHLPNSYIERSESNVLSYLVPRPDGSIIVGGSSRLFMPHREQWYGNCDDSKLIEASKSYYDGYMQRTFRGWENSGAYVDNIWTGVMGYSFDSNAHIGAVPGKLGQYIIAGFNGHGMPQIWLCTKSLAKMINFNIPIEESGVPHLLRTSIERLQRADASCIEHGDILGDGSLKPAPHR
ncbi:FAD dependent oxidoreductase superfamily [Polychaeton citri CBS 116435]|uniref:FAD dependent oxidoreductase superfamily n=1 Tax=Polychaeton citri CBS 116435 TaxID=1314669 RepID=A0A9P4UHV7_9PEZI|nr:FAD dependent oxidoreductase superfamily [Polychaeton citri CBS 116435]